MRMAWLVKRKIICGRKWRNGISSKINMRRAWRIGNGGGAMAAAENVSNIASGMGVMAAIGRNLDERQWL